MVCLGHMVVLTQIVYLHPGQEAAFDAFEAIALAAVERHGGELLLRLRPAPAATLAGSLAPPHEVHLVRFPDEAHLASFQADPTRASVLHLKSASVRETLLFRGS